MAALPHGMLAGAFIAPYSEALMSFSRRDFIAGAVVGSLSLTVDAQDTRQQDSKKAQVQTLAGKRPIIISAANGFPYIEEAFNMLRGGADTLDAATAQSTTAATSWRSRATDRLGGRPVAARPRDVRGPRRRDRGVRVRLPVR